MGHQIPFPCNFWQRCYKVHFKLNLKTNCMPCPYAPLRNLFQNNISPTVRNHLISSQKLFVPTHTSLFLCQHRLLSEAIFLLSWCSSTRVFREQRHALQLPSHLAKYAQVPSDGLCSLRTPQSLILSLLLSRFLFLEQRCENTGVDDPMSKQRMRWHSVISALEWSSVSPHKPGHQPLHSTSWGNNTSEGASQSILCETGL